MDWLSWLLAEPPSGRQSRARIAALRAADERASWSARRGADEPLLLFGSINEHQRGDRGVRLRPLLLDGGMGRPERAGQILLR